MRVKWQGSHSDVTSFQDFEMPAIYFRLDPAKKVSHFDATVKEIPIEDNRYFITNWEADTFSGFDPFMSRSDITYSFTCSRLFVV
jgi:hypothetical protein